MQLSLLAEPEECAAIDDGRLFLIVKEHPRYDSRAWGSHVRAGEFTRYSGPFATVHVMSRVAGGQIGGYVRLDGRLYIGLPAYVKWDALDAEVSRRLGCPVITSEARDDA